jgi:hypothetical protein
MKPRTHCSQCGQRFTQTPCGPTHATIQAQRRHARTVKALNEERLAVRRVLEMTNRYLKRQNQDLLVTEGRGLMTWGEIREHIKAATATKFLRTRVR